MGVNRSALGILAIMVAVVGCGGGGGGGGGVPPDPPGTVTTNLRSDGGGPASVDFETGSTPGNVGDFDIIVNSSNNFVTANGAQIIDVGPVPSVGAIAAVPSSGFTASAAAVIGHGYVVRTGLGRFFRFVADSPVISSTTGGTIGVRIRWAELVDPSLSTVSISPANPGIAPAGTVTFTLTRTNTDGSTDNVSATTAWSSSDTGVATIDATGKATAVATGTSTITGNFGGKTATTTLTVATPRRLVVTHASGANGTLKVVDYPTYTVAGTLAGGFAMGNVAIAKPSNRIYIANATGGAGNDNVQVVKADTLTLLTPISTGGGFGIAALEALPAENRLYALGVSTLHIINTTTDAIAGSVPVRSQALDLAIHAGARKAYVASNDNTVSVVNIDSQSVVGSPISVTGGFAVVVDATANRAYVAQPFQVSVIDTTTDAISGAPINIGGGNVVALAVHPAANRLYVARSVPSEILVYDTTTRALVQTVAVPAAPIRLTTDAVSKELFVTETFGLGEFHTTTNTYERELSSSGAVDVAVEP